ncbi:MAG TPA: glycosyl hydrolase family 28-related protein [Bryobacteraceae bacterium]|nr:glycosyl hydrolase family 28-related protein [Bryobacteraceae bacterium]
MGSHNSRRGFLRLAGTIVAGAYPGLAVAQEQSHAQNANTGTFGVRAFGAVGDGKTLDTAAINRAIEAAAGSGGGVVHFAAGEYLSYSIHLKSNVTLQLETGAAIIAANSPAPGSSVSSGFYDLAESNAPWESYQDYGHNHWHNSLIWGENLQDVAIVGPGLIWGRGLSHGRSRQPGPIAEQAGVGNKAIALKNCRNVLLRDFSILHGGHFGILATGVDNLTIDNLKIDTIRDGMDIDCCRNVRVSNCAVNSPWDDGICLKSSYALGEPRSCDMVTITNCFVSGSFEEGALLNATYKKFPSETRVPRTGRIKFGTESNGGFRNITISNCVFDGCEGLALESVDGALLEDVSISNLTMRDLTHNPFFIRLGERMRGPQGRSVGTMTRVNIGNVVCYNSASRTCSLISGVPGHAIEHLNIHDIYVEHQGGGTAEMTHNQVPEQENGYPDPGRFGVTPAHGFYIRHVKDIRMSNIEIVPQKQDLRPAFQLVDVQGGDFFRIETPRVEGVPTFVLDEVSNFSVARSGVPDRHVDHVDHLTL